MPSVDLPTIDSRRAAILDGFYPGLTKLAGIASVEGDKERFLLQLSELADQIAGSAGEAREVLLLLANAGWPPPMALDLNDLSVVRIMRDELDDQQFQDAICDVLLLRYQHEGIAGFKASWGARGWLGPRMHILSAALKAHERGEYALSVPILLTQLEGIIVSGYGHHGWLSQRQHASYLESLLKVEWDVMGDLALTHRLITERLLQDFKHGEKTPPMSRHAIIHGADTDYATEEISLKAILLLDRVIDAFGIIAVKGEECYHLPGCPTLSSASAERRIFLSEDLAKASRLLACAQCLPPNPMSERRMM